MSNKVTTQHFINGVNVKDLSKSECINIIRTAEADIATLEAIETESATVENEVKSLRKFIGEVVTHMDAKK